MFDFIYGSTTTVRVHGEALEIRWRRRPLAVLLAFVVCLPPVVLALGIAFHGAGMLLGALLDGELTVAGAAFLLAFLVVPFGMVWMFGRHGILRSLPRTTRWSAGRRHLEQREGPIPTWRGTVGAWPAVVLHVRYEDGRTTTPPWRGYVCLQAPGPGRRGIELVVAQSIGADEATARAQGDEAARRIAAAFGELHRGMGGDAAVAPARAA